MALTPQTKVGGNSEKGRVLFVGLPNETERANVMTFQEFLDKQAKQQHSSGWREQREEWIAAVGRLMEKLRDWLAESDPKKVLDVVPIEYRRIEPNLGIYIAPGLKISLNQAVVDVAPVGRNVIVTVGPHGDAGIRAEGRVDITDGIRKYVLYRTFKDGQEIWYAIDERFQAAPLDRSRLEAILQDLLS
jgi:hypothetical protein